MLALDNIREELKVKGGLVEIIPRDVDMTSQSLINTKNEHFPSFTSHIYTSDIVDAAYNRIRLDARFPSKNDTHLLTPCYYGGMLMQSRATKRGKVTPNPTGACYHPDPSG